MFNRFKKHLIRGLSFFLSIGINISPASMLNQKEIEFLRMVQIATTGTRYSIPALSVYTKTERGTPTTRLRSIDAVNLIKSIKSLYTTSNLLKTSIEPSIFDALEFIEKFMAKFDFQEATNDEIINRLENFRRITRYENICVLLLRKYKNNNTPDPPKNAF